MKESPRRLTPEAVRRICDPTRFSFSNTAELPLLNEVLGQPRAVAALEFGAGIASHGFNLFALGESGSGRTTLIRNHLERRAATEPVPPDLCYVYNFADARSPLPIRLPAGQGVAFRDKISSLVNELRSVIPKAFESEEFIAGRDQIRAELEEKRRQIITAMEERVKSAGFQILKTPAGLLLVPVVAGRPLTDEDLERLSPEDRQKVAHVRDRLQREIEERLNQIREHEKGAREAMRSLEIQTAAYAARHLINELRAEYRDQPEVLSYLDGLENDVIENSDEFRKDKETETPVPFPLPLLPPRERQFLRYEVNVIVDNGALKGAPVVVESNPTFYNLLGRIDHQSVWGGLVTNHTMIKAGALHRANGGYLILPVKECLMNPQAWEGLKRALEDGQIRIEELGTQLGLISTVSLDPLPVPLKTKVVLIGSPLLYYLLHAYDDDFAKLFKVKADFTTRMELTPENEYAYALFASTISHQENTLPFSRDAVARLVEYGSRFVDDQHALSTRFGDIADLLREAAHRAQQNSHTEVTAADLRVAEEARRFRDNLVEELIQQRILEGTIYIDTEGSAVGRINGLTVLQLGEYSFGQPVRLSATVGPGRGGIISIEREVELSGPIHGKGVLILSGYLLRTYGRKSPLNLSASLVFEQSYSKVEGDSATLAELCILLSAIAEIPLRQDIAVTGSVNQHGRLQPVGGVTEKVEGFFAICQKRGLSGTQGVIIPAANQRNLMLRDEVVEAIREERFHVWAADTVDEALHLLTGIPAGQPADDGTFPEGTIHRAVSDKLAEYAAILKAQAAAKQAPEAQE